MFYVGPIMVILPPLIYLWSFKAALVLLVIDLCLIFIPIHPWPWARGFFELWYEIFDMHTNIIPENFITKEKLDTLSIYAMHPHGIVPMQALFWPPICDQYMSRNQPLNPAGTPGMYGFGATTDAALRIPLLRQVFRWLDARSASKSVILKGLKTGQNLFIC